MILNGAGGSLILNAGYTPRRQAVVTFDQESDVYELGLFNRGDGLQVELATCFVLSANITQLGALPQNSRLVAQPGVVRLSDNTFINPTTNTLDVIHEPSGNTETALPVNFTTIGLTPHLQGSLGSPFVSSLNLHALTLTETNRVIFSDYANRIRNANLWFPYPEALEPLVCAYQASGGWGGYGNGGVLIAPRIVVFAAHYAPTVDDSIWFYKADSTPITTLIEDLFNINDIRVALLADPITLIKPMRIFNPVQFSRNTNKPLILPALYTNRFQGTETLTEYSDGFRLHCRYLVTASSSNYYNNQPASFKGQGPLDGVGYGDSGGANFLFNGIEPLLLNLNFTSTSGPSVYHNFDAIINGIVTNFGASTILPQTCDTYELE